MDGSSTTFLAFYDSGSYYGLRAKNGFGLPYELVPLEECGSSSVACLIPPANIEGYVYTSDFLESKPYVYDLYDSAPHYYQNEPGSEGRSWNQGTMLAGIVAALKNDQGMHGVAYNAEIIPAVADIFRPITSKAINTLISSGSEIILQDVVFNASAIYPTPEQVASQTIEETYGPDTATAYNNLLPNQTHDGIIFVVATGTDGYNNISSGIVSYYEQDPGDPSGRSGSLRGPLI